MSSTNKNSYYCYKLNNPAHLGLILDEQGFVLSIKWHQSNCARDDVRPAAHQSLTLIKTELDAFFAKQRYDFSKIILNMTWSDKAHRVYKLICNSKKILTYQEIANQLGMHARGVGAILKANPITVIIPCHLVKPTRTTDLGNYHGGRNLKLYLNEVHENNFYPFEMTIKKEG